GRVIGATGEPRWVDAFGHAYFDSPAQWLTQRLQAELGVRVRFDKPGTIQRMATGYVSQTDRAEAELVGRAAVDQARPGTSCVRGNEVTLRANETRAEPLERFAVAAGPPCRSAADAGIGAQVAVVIVLTADQAEQAIFGSHGLAETLAPGSVVVCMSTMAPAR